jgi:hypothetical protein
MNAWIGRVVMVPILLPIISGCTLSDALFSAFGGYYTEGGYTREEKRYHYQGQVDESRRLVPATGLPASSQPQRGSSQ